MIWKCKNIDKDFFNNHSVLKNHLPLLEKIKTTFLPEDNVLFIKAPGRINLIGEHTDYNMGPVFPCAIDKEIIFCVRKNDTNNVCLKNVNPKFSDLRFSLQKPIDPYSNGYWGNYIKAGVKGIIDYLQLNYDTKHIKIYGFDAVVSGTLPPAAGLSSSSALVVASALSLVIINQLAIKKPKIAEICAKAEHFVGTAGGGMDQAASLLGKKNSFLKMEFNPLKTEAVPAPQGLELILFHSLIEAEKSGQVREEYNRRVLECRMAVDLFNQHIAMDDRHKRSVVNYIGEIKPQHFNMDVVGLDIFVSGFLRRLPDSFTKDEFCSKLGVPENEIVKKYRDILRSDSWVEPSGGFKIKSRFKHVYWECRRVTLAAEYLSQNNISELGRLINESHNSLSNDYEVSLPRVDELVKMIVDNGALGARIMGAGYGGMVLALSRTSQKELLIKKVKEKYYKEMNRKDIENYVFTCQAADGAGELS